MTAQIKSVTGQSLYDLCLMAYGTLDLLIKFITDNGILDVNYVPVQPMIFNYDTTLVTIGKTNNYVYATAISATGRYHDPYFDAWHD